MYQRTSRCVANTQWITIMTMVMCIGSASPAQPVETGIKELFKKKLIIDGVQYVATVLARSRLTERRTEDGRVRKNELTETLLSLGRSDRDSEDRITWWNLAPQAGLGVVTGDRLFDVCSYRCDAKTVLLLVIANTYYHGYSVIIVGIDQRCATVPEDWRSEEYGLRYDDKRLLARKAESELLVLPSRSTNKSDPYGTKSIHISVDGDTIIVNRVSKSGKAITEAALLTQAERARVLGSR